MANFTFYLTVLEEKMCPKRTPNWSEEIVNKCTTDAVLVAWMVYVNWNAIDSQHRFKVNMTELGVYLLFHGLSVKCVLFVNDREENIGVPKGLHYRHQCQVHF